MGDLQEHLDGVLDEVLEDLQPLGPDGTIDDAVVAAQGHGHHGSHAVRLGSRGLGFVGDDLLLGATDGKDAGLRRVDHGGELLDPVHPEVRYRERSALEFRGLQLLLLGLGGEVLDVLRDGDEAFLVSVEYNRREEAIVGADRDVDVHVVVPPDEIPHPCAVGDRLLPQRQGSSFDNEVVHRQLVLALAFSIQVRTNPSRRVSTCLHGYFMSPLT